MSALLEQQLRDSLAVERKLQTLREFQAAQWMIAADITEGLLLSVKAGVHTAGEALEFLAAEFRKAARP